MGFLIATALEKGGARVDGRRIQDSRSRRGGRSSLSYGATAHGVGLRGREAEHNLAGGGDGSSLRGRSGLNNSLGSRTDAENRRAVSLAVVSLEKSSHIRNRLAFGRQLSNGCAGRSQEDERAGEHYN